MAEGEKGGGEGKEVSEGANGAEGEGEGEGGKEEETSMSVRDQLARYSFAE